MSIKVTMLMENNAVENTSLINEHGLSFYIEKDEHTFLFDTGQTGAFIDNAKILNCDLNKVEKVILSHGHYDHANGYPSFVDFVDEPQNKTLYISNNFFAPKYSYDKKDNSYVYKGANFDEQFLFERDIAKYNVTEQLTEIYPGVFLISNFHRHSNFEKDLEKFKIRKDPEYILDSFKDEIMIALKSSKGLVVIVGCSHPGIVNMVETTRQLLNENVYCVIGGTHLVAADDRRIQETIDYFKKTGVELVGTSHCTGNEAMGILAEQLQDKFFACGIGSILDVD